MNALKIIAWRIGITSEPIMFVYMLVFITNIVSLPQLIIDKLSLDNISNASDCAHSNSTLIQEDLQEEASVWMFRYLMFKCVLSFFTVLFAGPISDMFGYKRTLLCFPVMGFAQQAVVLYFSKTLASSSLWLLASSGVLVGLSGDIQGCVGVCASVISIATAKAQTRRTARLLLLDLFQALPAVIAGLFLGPLLQRYGYSTLYTLNMSLYVVLFVYIILVIPNKAELLSISVDGSSEESPLVKKETSGKIVNTEKGDSCVPIIKRTILHSKIMWQEMDSNKRKYLICLLFTYATAIVGVSLDNNLTSLYLTNAPFNLEARQIGYFVLLLGASRAVGQLGMSIFTLHFHSPPASTDYLLLMVGLSSHAALYLMTGVARSFEIAMLANVFGMFSALPISVVKSMATKLVGVQHHCTVVNIVMATDVLTILLSNLTILPLYAATLHCYSGIVYFIASFAAFCSILLFYIIFRRYNNTQEL